MSCQNIRLLEICSDACCCISTACLDLLSQVKVIKTLSSLSSLFPYFPYSFFNHFYLKLLCVGFQLINKNVRKKHESGEKKLSVRKLTG